MPKCPKCGKKFGSIQALNDHFRSIHPNEKFVAPKQPSSARTLLVIIIIVILVVGGLVGYLIYVQSTQKSPTSPVCTTCIGEPLPSDLYQNLTGISSSTLITIGTGQGVTKPAAITGSALTDNGKPEVLYIGADFCPFCAAERWALIIALSEFGTFSNLSLMLSSATDIASNTATFSFFGSNYSSSYISFVSVESEDRSEKPLQTITVDENSLLAQYDPATSSCTTGGCIPFVDIGNKYSVVGSQFSTDLLRVGSSANGAPLNWTQIGSQLNNPSNTIAKAIDGSANTLISAICSITGGNPTSVCTQSYAKISLAIVPELSGSQSSPIISVVLPVKIAEPLL